MRCCRESPSTVRFADSPEISEAIAVSSLSVRKGRVCAPALVAMASAISSLRTVQRRSPVQARAEGGEADQHAGLDAAVGETFVEEDRQSAGGRVAVALDVVRHFLGRQSELLGDRFGDSQIRLVAKYEIDVPELHARQLADRAHRFG